MSIAKLGMIVPGGGLRKTTELTCLKVVRTVRVFPVSNSRSSLEGAEQVAREAGVTEVFPHGAGGGRTKKKLARGRM